jgi:hypothetical protein
VDTAGDVNGDSFDDLIIGAAFNDASGANAGAAYVYFGSSSGPEITDSWSPYGESADDYFGSGVSRAGDVNGDGSGDILIGAYYNDDTDTNAGEAYVYAVPIEDIFKSWSDTGETTLDYYGGSTSSAGDVNGDGYNDIIVGAYLNDGAGTDAGEVYVYFGSASGPSSTPDWSDQGEAVNDTFGIDVDCAGDVNGDGYDDIIVGAYRNNGAGAGAGEVYVYFGSASGPGAAPNWSDQGSAAGDQFGWSVAGAGDVNSDGYDDIIIGAPRNDTTGFNSGTAYVYFGSASGLSASPSWARYGEADSDNFGWSVAGAGDVNGDDYDDVIISAPYNDEAASLAGKVYYYLGYSGGLVGSPSWNATGESAEDIMGISIAGAGDINGDDYDDIIVGAPYNDDGGAEAGKIYVYYGRGTGPGATPAWTDQGEADEDYLGSSVDGAGDINGDGYDDIVAGAYGNGDSGHSAGKVYIHYGSANGLNSTPAWSKPGEAQLDRFGASVSGAGDTNRDGYDDIIVGARSNNDNGVFAGKAYLFSTARYAERGRFISDTFSIENNDDFNWLSIDWLPFIQPKETNVRFQIATNDDGVKWDFVGPDGTANTSFTDPHGQMIPAGELGRFMKVRAYLSTTLGSIRPTVSEFSVNYEFLDIVDPQVVVTSPNGGEDWMKDKYYPITWDAEGDFNQTPVSIYFSINNGGNWTPIVEWVENIGVYNWTVPNLETGGAMIGVMITDIYGNWVVDTSDATFAIDPPPVSVFNDQTSQGTQEEDTSNILGDLGSDPSQVYEDGEHQTTSNIDTQNDNNYNLAITLGFGFFFIILIISLIFNFYFVTKNKTKNELKNNKSGQQMINKSTRHKIEYNKINTEREHRKKL